MELQLYCTLIHENYEMGAPFSSTMFGIIKVKSVGLSYSGTCQSICFEPTHDCICRLVMHMDAMEVFLHLKDIFHSIRVGWKNKRKK